MNYLLDTHVLIWSRLDPKRLTNLYKAIVTGDDQKFVSTISIWEISLKFASGRLELGGHTPEEFLWKALAQGYQIVAPSADNFATYYRLPIVDGHKDPFDRMLVWQAIQDKLILLSHDRKLSVYQTHGLKIA